MPDVAALIIGIDGWERYTRPLVESLRQWEPSVRLVVIDNESAEPYPAEPYIYRTLRLSYSAAITEAHRLAGDADWYIVLSNDVLCNGPFVEMMQAQGEAVTGPRMMTNQGWQYLEGWVVAATRKAWDAIGGWDRRFIMSSWEDVDFSQSAIERGIPVRAVAYPFIHLDQRQRFVLPNYGGSEGHNFGLFMRKREPLRVGA